MNFSAVSRRFWALTFDYIIIGSIMYVVILVLRMNGTSIFPVEEIIEGKFSALSKFYLIYAMIYLIYEIGFLSSNLSATPGKIIMDMEVACTNANILKVFIRSLIKLISSVTGLYIIFFTIAIFNEKKQSVHDLFAGSFVIDKEKTNSGGIDLTQDISKTEAFKSSKSSILSSSLIWVLVLVISIGFSVIGGKVLVSDMISEMKTMPQFKDNGVVVEQSIAEKYVGTWANDKRTVGFTVYYVKKTGIMYINTSKGALSFMFDRDNVLYIIEGENKFKVRFSSDSYDAVYMTGPINSQLEYKYLLQKE